MSKDVMVFEKKEARTVLAVILIIAAVALIGIAVAYFYYPEIFAVAPPAPPVVTAEKIIIHATPRQTGYNFPSGLVITGTILDKDLLPVGTVSLTSPTWSASLEDLNLTGQLYVRFAVSDMYWYYWEFLNTTVMNGQTYAIIPISEDSAYYRPSDKAIVLEPHFVNVSTLEWNTVESRSGLGTGPSMITLTNTFNQTGNSLAYNVKLSVTCNSTVFNMTSITFGGVTIPVSGYNITASGWSVNVTLAQLLENIGAGNATHTVLVSGNWVSAGNDALLTYKLYLVDETEVEVLVDTAQATLAYS